MDPNFTELAIYCRDERKKAKLAAQEEIESRFLEEVQTNLKKWCESQEASEKIALARLIRYINKYAKTFPKYKHQSDSHKEQLGLIYSLKDDWILQNKENCIEHCKSSEEYQCYVDWEQLNNWRYATGEWQDSDDFLVEKTITFYAYVFSIEGEEFRFHSKQALFPEDVEAEPNPEAQGSTEALKEDEKVISLAQACGMTAVMLKKWSTYYKYYLKNLFWKELKKQQKKGQKKGRKKGGRNRRKS
jgi:hypothetical protein